MIARYPLDELKGDPRNPKSHDEEAIATSLQRFGYVEPIVVDTRTGQLVAGHGRVETLRQMRGSGIRPPDGVNAADGTWEVPVIEWASRNDDEAAAYLVASNRLTELGGWHNDLLSDFVTALGDVDPQLVEDSGFQLTPQTSGVTNDALGDKQHVNSSLGRWKILPAMDVPMTKEQIAHIRSLVTAHADRAGSGLGFINWLCGEVEAIAVAEGLIEDEDE